MQIGIVKEKKDHRVALTPDGVKALQTIGHEIIIEKGAGDHAFFSDTDYSTAGATLADRKKVLQEANLIVSIYPITTDEISSGEQVHISMYEPYQNTEVVSTLVQHSGITAFSLDMIPRTTLAQSMDVLSSMASITGYKAVLRAADLLPSYFPMLSTAAGTIRPARVLILGVGVAGLQAIATAKRLGAVVEAFDTRSAVKEQVESLGAKFVDIEGATDDASAGGYAVAQSEDFMDKMRSVLHDRASQANVVITTAQLRGKPAPTLITTQTVEAMPKGAVIIDTAASTGGNCELTQNDQTIIHEGITIVGNSNLAADMPMNASELFSKNVCNLLKILHTEEGTIDFDNEIVSACCIAHQGKDMYNR